MLSSVFLVFLNDASGSSSFHLNNNIKIQRYIPAALAALQNFIRINNMDKIDELAESIDAEDHIFGRSHAGDDTPGNDIPFVQGSSTADARRDAIAQAMWNQYLRVLEERANVDESSEDNGTDEEDGHRESNENDLE